MGGRCGSHAKRFLKAPLLGMADEIRELNI